MDIKVIGVAESNWGIKESGSIIYDVNINNVPTTVEFLPGGSGDSDWLNIKSVNGKPWETINNLYKLLHLDPSMLLQELTLSIEKAIKAFEFKKTLNLSTAKTFSELIDEL
jgi:hypothetical protein